jgi:hypothetical protein
MSEAPGTWATDSLIGPAFCEDVVLDAAQTIENAHRVLTPDGAPMTDTLTD